MADGGFYQNGSAINAIVSRDTPPDNTSSVCG